MFIVPKFLAESYIFQKLVSHEIKEESCLGVTEVILNGSAPSYSIDLLFVDPSAFICKRRTPSINLFLEELKTEPWTDLASKVLRYPEIEILVCKGAEE